MQIIWALAVFSANFALSDFRLAPRPWCNVHVDALLDLRESSGALRHQRLGRKPAFHGPPCQPRCLIRASIVWNFLPTRLISKARFIPFVVDCFLALLKLFLLKLTEIRERSLVWFLRETLSTGIGYCGQVFLAKGSPTIVASGEGSLASLERL